MQFLLKSLQNDPDNVVTLGVLSAAYDDLGERKKSSEFFERAVEIVPDNPRILNDYTFLGNLLFQEQKFDQAVKFLLVALENDPENAVIMGVLGAAYDELDEKEKSAGYYEKALKIQPDNSVILNNYGYSLSVRGERLDDALEMVNKALETDPENGAFLDTIGWVYYKLGDYDKALEYIKKSAAIRGGSAEVLEHLGDVYEKLGQMDLAIENWKKAMELDPDRESLTTKLQNN